MTTIAVMTPTAIADAIATASMGTRIMTLPAGGPEPIGSWGTAASARGHETVSTIGAPPLVRGRPRRLRSSRATHQPDPAGAGEGMEAQRHETQRNNA